MKKTLLTVLVAFLAVGIATGCGCKKKSSNNNGSNGSNGNNGETKTEESYNTNEDVIKDQEVEGISFKNAKLENNNLEVEVSSATSQSIKTIDVVYKDNNGTEITRLSGYVGNTIDNDVKRLVVGTDEDISNAYSIEYIINK